MKVQTTERVITEVTITLDSIEAAEDIKDALAKSAYSEHRHELVILLSKELGRAVK